MKSVSYTCCIYITLLINSCCTKYDKLFILQDREKIFYPTGKLLLYKDSTGSIDTFRIDVMEYDRSGNSPDEDGKHCAGNTYNYNYINWLLNVLQ